MVHFSPRHSIYSNSIKSDSFLYFSLSLAVSLFQPLMNVLADCPKSHNLDIFLLNAFLAQLIDDELMLPYSFFFFFFATLSIVTAYATPVYQCNGRFLLLVLIKEPFLCCCYCCKLRLDSMAAVFVPNSIFHTVSRANVPFFFYLFLFLLLFVKWFLLLLLLLLFIIFISWVYNGVHFVVAIFSGFLSWKSQRFKVVWIKEYKQRKTRTTIALWFWFWFVYEWWVLRILFPLVLFFFFFYYYFSTHWMRGRNCRITWANEQTKTKLNCKIA